MTKNDRVLLGAIFIILFIVMVLQAGIYWNTRPPEEYEVITVTGTVNVTALEEAGFISQGYHLIEVVEEDIGFRRERCEICEAIQSGNITFISWDETLLSDNFTVITKDSLAVRGREE